MALKDIILGRFAWNRTRREKVPASLECMSLAERRQAVYALVVGSVAPRSIHLHKGSTVLSIEAGNGQILEVEQRDVSGVLYRLDCTARPAMTLGDADKAQLLAQFLGFLDGGQPVTVALDPVAEERSGHQGLSPELLIADERQFGLRLPAGTAGAKPEPDAAELVEADAPAPEQAEAADLADEPSGAEIPVAARPLSLAPVAASPLLRDYAGRLREHVLEVGLRSDLVVEDRGPACGIDHFVAAAGPALGSTLLFVYLGPDDTVESYAVAADSGDTAAVRFRRSRAGKVFHEWIGLAAPNS